MYSSAPYCYRKCECCRAGSNTVQTMYMYVGTWNSRNQKLCGDGWTLKDGTASLSSVKCNFDVTTCSQHFISCSKRVQTGRSDLPMHTARKANGLRQTSCPIWCQVLQDVVNNFHLDTSAQIKKKKTLKGTEAAVKKPFLWRIHGERTAPLQKDHATGVDKVTTMLEVAISPMLPVTSAVKRNTLHPFVVVERRNHRDLDRKKVIKEFLLMCHPY